MIHIIADTTSCIPTDEAKKIGLEYIPQIIVFGEDTYRDDTEMDASMFLKRLQASPVLPKTAAPPPALYTPIYRQYAEKGDTMIVICPTSALSGTYRSAQVAAKDFPEADIRIIDTRIIAGGLGALVKQSLDWVSQGLDADTVTARVEEMAKRNKTYFVVDTLEYLFKGGRIGAAKALFGSLLQVKPILNVVDGLIEPCENQRTHKRAIGRIKELITADCHANADPHLWVMHGNVEEEARQIAANLGEMIHIPQEKIIIGDLPPAVLVHAGPGVIAISYFTAPEGAGR